MRVVTRNPCLESPADSKMQNAVILVDIPLAQSVLSDALLKLLAWQVKENTAAEKTTVAASGGGTFETILLDAAASNPAVVVGNILRTNSSARILGFFMENILIDIAAWEALGVTVYTSRQLSSDTVLKCLLQSSGNKRTPGGAAGVARKTTRSANSSQSRPGKRINLTAREEEIIRLVAAGESNKDIARSLNIGLATVKTHVHHLLNKLGVERRGKLILQHDARSTLGSYLLDRPITASSTHSAGEPSPQLIG